MQHDLKVWPVFFDALMSGDKSFEVRKNDRSFRVEDTLLLREWDDRKERYTGRSTTKTVTYVMLGGHFGIAEDYLVMGIREAAKGPRLTADHPLAQAALKEDMPLA